MIEFVKYFRDAMASRRGLGLRVFTGVMILFFFLAIEGFDTLKDFKGTCDELKFIKYAIMGIYAAIAIIFTIFISLIEARSKPDRRNYTLLEVTIRAHFQKKKIEDIMTPSERAIIHDDYTFYKRILTYWTVTYWAGTSPIIVTLGFAVLFMIYFWLFL